MDSERIIVITGAAGFIGSAAVKHLNELGFKNLVLVDDLEKSDKWKNLVGKQYADLIPISRCFDWLKARSSEVQAILHLGACSSTVERDADYLLENNYRFTIRLAELALENDIRFVYASSAATYGDGSLGFCDDHDLLDQLQPLNMYGYSKHMADLWMKSQGVLDQVAGLKYFNVFGPNEYHKERMASAVKHFLPTVQNEGMVKLFKSNDPARYGDGEQKRDFIYVKDCVRMTCEFLSNRSGGIYNVGSGIASSWNQLATAMFQALDKPVQIQYIEMPKDLHGKYQNYTCASVDKIQKSLQNAATMPLHESVKEYVLEYLMQDRTW